MATLGQKLARWVSEIDYDRLPEKTIHEVKRRIVDSLGCALGAYGSDPARIARGIALDHVAPSGAQIWGQKERVHPEMAAFANGAMVRYLDFNDTYLSREPAHPSDNIPAVLAVAQKTGATGKDAILACAIAYEIQCRLCDAASLRTNGWDHVVYGALSSALATGRLLGLSVKQLEHALGLAGVCNIATRQTRTGQLSMWKACAFSNAARNGIFAADLAKRGMTGPFEIFEGPKGIFNQLTGSFTLDLDLWKDYMIDRTYIKFWPAEYHSQSAIDAALQLGCEINSFEEIARIEIESFEAAVSIIGSEPEKWRPTSRETADHSMAYCVVVSLVDGELTRDSFDEKRLSDPRLLKLLDKCSIVEKDLLNEGYPEGIPNELIITLKSGQTLRKRVDFPRGHYRNPMTDSEVIAKFSELSKSVIRPKAADRILSTAWALDELSDLEELLSFSVET